MVARLAVAANLRTELAEHVDLEPLQLFFEHAIPPALPRRQPAVQFLERLADFAGRPLTHVIQRAQLLQDGLVSPAGVSLKQSVELSHHPATFHLVPAPDVLQAPQLSDKN